MNPKQFRPILTLSNGKKVANFSSPHSFTFEDGSVLEAVSPEKSRLLSMEATETASSSLLAHEGDTLMSYKLTPMVLSEIDYWDKKYGMREVDVVYVPLIVLQAIHDHFGHNLMMVYPFRVIRIVDRVTKVCSIDTQCVL